MKYPTLRDFKDSGPYNPLEQDVDEDKLLIQKKVVDESTFTASLPPPPESRLIITSDFAVYTRQPMPSHWVRFWYRFLLGWRWEAIEQ